MNGYIAIYNGKQIEIHAETQFKAQEQAKTEFQKTTRKKVKSWDISVMLCEKEEDEKILQYID